METPNTTAGRLTESIMHEVNLSLDLTVHQYNRIYEHILAQSEKVLGPLESELAMRDGVLNMAVARLGGKVEGRPTARLNFGKHILDAQASLGHAGFAVTGLVLLLCVLIGVALAGLVRKSRIGYAPHPTQILGKDWSLVEGVNAIHPTRTCRIPSSQYVDPSDLMSVIVEGSSVGGADHYGKRHGNIGHASLQSKTSAIKLGQRGLNVDEVIVGASVASQQSSPVEPIHLTYFGGTNPRFANISQFGTGICSRDRLSTPSKTPGIAQGGIVLESWRISESGLDNPRIGSYSQGRRSSRVFVVKLQRQLKELSARSRPHHMSERPDNFYLNGYPRTIRHSEFGSSSTSRALSGSGLASGGNGEVMRLIRNFGGLELLRESLFSYFVSFLRLPIHSSKSLLESRVVPVQSFSSQAIGPANLRPLERGEHSVNKQDKQAAYLKAKFGILAPLIGAVGGMILAGWGWWRIRRASSGRQAGAGFAALVGGYLVGSIAGIIFMIVAF